MAEVILAGVDGSEGSLRAAKYAANNASRIGAGLVVVFVIEWSPFSFNTPEENEQRHKRREAEIASAHEKVLEPLLGEIRESGVSVEGVVRHGHIARVLIDQAEERGASAIFIGRLGDSSFKSVIFGSVASNLVQTSPVPVTVVP